MTTENKQPEYTEEEITQLKIDLATRWLDPVKRVEDIFNIRDGKGRLKPVFVPDPQKVLLREGILGDAREKIEEGLSHITITNKGRQEGYSVFNAYESILIAEDFPNTNIYFVATEIGQARDWMQKMTQLIEDSNYFPEELGGGRMLNITSLKKIEEKVINNTYIVGLAANPSAIRGKTGIAVYFDEAAWALRTKGIATETWKALSYIISQGGQGRIQSTPRTTDDKEFFWGTYQKALQKKGGMVAYECPVIENHKELDLTEPLIIVLNNDLRNKYNMEEFTEKEIEFYKEKYSNMDGFIVSDDYIQQPAIVLYPWKSLIELENDRERDYQQFMQEYLCQPIDETLKMIQSMWIEQNIVKEKQYYDRGTSTNSFQICCDFAKERDYSAFIVTEKIVKNDMPIFYQRHVSLSQEKYYIQAKLITELYERFKPDYISIDATGVGNSVYEQLELEMVKKGYNPKIIRPVKFGSANNEIMAEGFRALCTPKNNLTEQVEIGIDDNDKPIYDTLYKNQYRFLRDKGNKEHIEAISHIKRVEKEVLMTNIRYSGKRYGRDDAFWAAAQLCIHEKIKQMPRASFGKTSTFSQKIVSMTEQQSPGQQFVQGINKKRWETSQEKEKVEKIKKQRSLVDQHQYRKKLKFAYDCLKNSKNVCKTQKKIVNPIECVNPDNCRNKDCRSYQYCLEISERYQVKIEELYNLYQKIYK